MLKPFAVLLLLGLSLSSLGQTLSQSRLFRRCYSQLVGKPLSLAHPLYKQVEKKQISGVAACEKLIDAIELEPSTGLLTQQDPESISVLNKLNNFHRSWFPTNAHEQIQGFNYELHYGTGDIYDTTEAGLAITRAAFTKGANYSEVLTAPFGVHGIRRENSYIRNIAGWTVTYPTRRVGGNNTASDLNIFHFYPLDGVFQPNSDAATNILIQIPKIEVGDLVGVRPKTESLIIPNLALRPLASGKPAIQQPGLNYQFDMYKSFGGGVLGTPAFMLLNFGHEQGLEFNGTTKLPRRWAQVAMNSLLCTHFPALRESDIRSFFVGNSSAPFRNGASCLGCHATMDQMAYTMRNMTMGNTNYTNFSIGSKSYAKLSTMVTSYRAELPSVEGWPSEPVPDFHRQVPSGRLYFRSFSGRLVDEKVPNVQELGRAMSQTDDFYQCAAKRYFEFMTGISVALYDRTDPNNSEINKQLSQGDQKDRMFVEKLAEDLKASQSIKKLIKSILASSYYGELDFRP